jgi:hypothetical protein
MMLRGDSPTGNGFRKLPFATRSKPVVAQPYDQSMKSAIRSRDDLSSTYPVTQRKCNALAFTSASVYSAREEPRAET